MIKEGFRGKSPEGFMDLIYEEFVGRKVKPIYSKRERTYTVLDIDFDQSPATHCVVRRKTGAPITDPCVKMNLLEYYYDAYKIKIHDERQPLLKVKMPRAMMRKALEDLY